MKILTPLGEQRELFKKNCPIFFNPPKSLLFNKKKEEMTHLIKIVREKFLRSW